jgi:hypothetical protein
LLRDYECKCRLFKRILKFVPDVIFNVKRNIQKSFKYYATLFYGLRIKMYNERLISGGVWIIFICF